MLRIEQGWALHIDGLIIQRYFLHVYPWMKGQLEVETSESFEGLVKRMALKDNNGAADPIKSVYLHKKDWLWRSAISQDMAPFMAGIEKSFELLEEAGLYFVPQLGSAGLHIEVEGGEHKQWFVRCHPADSVMEGSVRILRDAARNLALAFLQADSRHFEKEKKWQSPWSVQPVDTEAYFLQLFSASLVHEFYTRLDMKQPAEAEKSLLLQVPSDAYESLLDELKDMKLEDMLNLYYPGPNRFQKYINGKLAGQQ